MPKTPLAASVRMIQALSGDPADVIERLNDAFIQAYLESDAAAFDELLADDFLVTLSDGRFLGKALFLSLATRPTDVTDHRLEDLRIRVSGDSAIVHATTVFTRANGTVGETRYTDVYTCTDGRWRVIAAHLTTVAYAVNAGSAP